VDRIPALDGIRAFALVLIMGFHFGVGWLQGGFFALDIFYVLSGYLITGLLISEYRKRGCIKLSAFWLRRARRLFPALLIVLVAVTIMVRFAEPAGLYPDFRMDALSALFYFSNWWQIASSSNYFVMSGAAQPLTHTWSLAVEEQFYLIWPLVTLAVMASARTFIRGVKILLIVSAVGAAASAIEMVQLFDSNTNTTRIYFGTDTHAQSILLGTILACVMTMIQTRRGLEGSAPAARSRISRGGLVLVGLAGFAGTLTLEHLETGASSFDYRGGFMLSALCGAAIIIGAVCVPGGPIAVALSLRPMVWLGTISYGAYLWHFPVGIYLDAERTGLNGLALLAVRAGSTISLATISYYLVERPVKDGRFWRSLKAAIPATALMAGTVAVVLAGTASDAVAIPSTPIVVVPSGPAHNGSITILMVGDSTALTLGLTLSYASVESKYRADVIDVATEGCGVAEGAFVEVNGTNTPTAPACNSRSPDGDQWPALLEGNLVRFRPHVVVLLAGYWESVNRTDQAGQVANITEPNYARYVGGQLQRFVDIAVSGGSRVVLMTAPYYDAGELPDGQSPPQDDQVRVNDYNDLVRDVAKNNPATVAVDGLNKIVSPHGRFASTIGNITVRAPDGIHFAYFQPFDETAPLPDTYAQVGALARWLDPKLFPVILAEARKWRPLAMSSGSLGGPH